MFVDFFVRRPVFATVCSIIIVLVGAVCIPLLPVDYYPEVTPPAVTVTANYSGASAQTVETAVTNVLEQEINGVEGMRYIASTSTSDGTSQIVVTFDSSRDVDQAAIDVQNRISQVQSQLPEEVIQNGIGVQKSGGSTFLQFISLSSEAGEYDTLFISNYADLYIKDALRRIRGVSSVEIFGERKYAMRIWLQPDQLASRRLSAQDVVDAVRGQNVQVAAGQIGRPPVDNDQLYQLNVLAQGRLQEISEFENIILKTGQDGSIVRIKDVGRVELGAQSYDTTFRINGIDAVGIGVSKLTEANALEISRTIRQTMEELSRSFPPGLTYKIPYDTTLFIEESIQEVIKTLLESIGLVVLVLFIFLQDWRVTLIPAITIPVSLLGTFAFVKLLGFSINTLTMFGLTLATGLVVDDAIVVVENITRYIQEERMPPVQAALVGMREVFTAVIATTLVLLALFLPVAFFPGTSGKIYQQFALTIAVSVSISTFNAVTLAPALSALFMKPQEGQQVWILRMLNQFIEGLRSGYEWILGGLVRARALIVLLFVGCLGLTYWLFTLVPTGFVPTEDQGYMITFIQGPPGVSLNYTDQVIGQATDILQGIESVEDTVAVGGFSFAGASPANALVFASLKPWSERPRPDQSASAIVGSLFGPFLGGISQALVIPIEPPSIQGLGSASGFDYQLQDRSLNDLNILEQTAKTLFFVGSQRPELQVNPPGFSAGDPQVRVAVDRDKAQLLGVQPTDVFNTLQTLLGGTYVNNFDVFNRNYRVYVQADQDFRSNPEDIGKFYVRSQTSGSMIPLSNLVETETSSGPQIINHYNLYRSVQLQGTAQPGFSSGQAIQAMQQLSSQVLPQGMGYEWTGISLEELESGGQASFIFALGLIFVFLVLAAQFESYITPLIILLAVPLAILGALSFQLLRGLENDVFCQVGLVMLIGLASKNSILIVEFANQLRQEGLPIIKAAIQAAETRFRAILMTALSTILGIYPLAVATGAGSGSRQSLGTAVLGGMAVSTLLSLFIVPVLYIVIRGIEERFLPTQSPE
ncbi:MAG: multidrug efflux RND transporter permease subunit [Cyanobacteriota bacterium]|nr:multidrug efflux RND transporter permease subunit [Cyanobacteriota bacterium]